MSNVTLIVLGLLVSALGGGACTFILALLRQNEYLKKESAALAQDFFVLFKESENAKENLIRNAKIAREYQVLAGDLEEKVEEWKFKAYQQNQKFLLAARHLTLEQVEQIEKDIQSL